MAEIWAAATAIVGAGAAVYSAVKPGPKAPDPRNLGGELGAINDQYNNLSNQLTGGTGNFNSLGTTGLNTAAGGDIDVEAFLKQRPDFRGPYENVLKEKGGDRAATLVWLQSAMKDSGIDPNTVPRQGGVGDVSAQLNTQNRTANINDVKSLAQDYTSVLKGTNQDYYNQLNHFTAAANAPVGPNASQTQAQQMASQGYGSFNPNGLMVQSGTQGNPLLSQLNNQAMTQGPSALQQQQNGIASGLLSQGGNLSASDLRNIQQNSRAGFAARGLDATNASVVDETFQTDAAQRARLQQNLGIAQGVQNQGLQEQNLQNQFGLGVANQNYASNALNQQGQIANQNFGLNSFNSNLQAQQGQQSALNQQATLSEQQRQAQLQAMLAATQAQQGGNLDPYSAILNGTNQNLLSGALSLYGTNAGTQNNLLNTLYGYGQDLNNTNYNANAAANIAGSNQNAALTGSLIGAGGQLGSAYLRNQGSTGGTQSISQTQLARSLG